MYSFLKKVISTVIPWRTDHEENDLQEEEQRIINSIKSFDLDSEDISKDSSPEECGDQNDTLRDTLHDTIPCEVETFKCVNKSGKITHLCDEYGLIDGTIYFEPSRVLNGLTVNFGDEVLYSSYQLKENETHRVYKIYALKDDPWNSEEIVAGFESEGIQKLELNAISRVVTGRVTQRKGREVYIESANIWCHLDKVQASFIPYQGDWVELQTLVSICEDSVNLMGDILEVISLKPLLTKRGTGRITFWADSKKEGVVENLIYFTSVSCEENYAPNLGDVVEYEAVESDQESLRWRAVKISLNNSKEKKKRMDDIITNASYANDVFRDKNGISISPTVCEVEVELNQTKTVVIEVTNHGSVGQCLKRTAFQRKRNSQLVLVSPKVTNNLLINSNGTIKFQFQCKGSSLGLTGEIFSFYFKDFLIAKRFEINVVGNKDMNQLLECKFDTVVKVHHKKNYFKNNIKPDVVLYGPRPWKPSRFIVKERKCVFKIPQKLLNTLGKISGEKVIKAVTDYAPYLKTELNFEHYFDRFHTLLYLEEIEVKVNFQKYDLKEVCLTRSDEFFVLEIPGLVEKKPSLIAGDKIVLTQPWQDSGKVKHIGFIYYVREKEIYVKFHPDFHEAYNETECDISFEPNINFFMRCHESINRAKKVLGKEWLFPNSVNEKPPIIDFNEFDEREKVPESVASFIKQIPKDQIENKLLPNSVDVKEIESNLIEDLKKKSFKKKLVWANKNLNERQKLAVVNVLEGRGRPLPYIIFGPPGTGKTVTLVEIIIQIYRLLPDSRILISTPSNSSADLISERLIELGNFKPGQLVRLLALYRAIEGLVPPKLVPYSSFFCVRRNGRELADMYGKSKIKSLSMEELPGRQRITVGTCFTVGLLHYLGLPPGHFTHILVDEAGQTSEPEILISSTFQSNRNGQIILTGDPQQLGPVVCSSIARRFGLGISLLERLISTFPYTKDFHSFPDTSGYDPRFITKLNVNYRSVPEILSLPSKLFYNSDLTAAVSETDSREAKIIQEFNFKAENRKKPPAIIFHGVIGQNYQEKDSPSWYNPHEIWQVVFYLRKLYSIGLKNSDIGIVTPYSKQVQKLKNLLPSLDLALPKIGSVEEFQGQERYVIIVSSVRSSAKYVHTDIIHSLGFIASPQRLNVALTRSRALLIIIGNPLLLSQDPYWTNVVNYCVNNNSYVGCDLNFFKSELKDNSTNETTENKIDDTDPGD